jgi:hypothetical protein
VRGGDLATLSRMRSFLIPFVFAAGLATGCGNPNQMMDDTLRTRASFDLNCPAEQLKLTDLDRVTSGVDGCGRRGTYTWIPSENRWVRNRL